ncbi:Tungsten-containing aldehyde:ferredoxin oxidoreductase (EC [Olavius sp. associated proteobacterium Delta 1]|nr:Tungsten-containing aldehyde:ferredoxin oxidoreductase (EC [Olavius sp. associated proteobacterium Delta 1]
MSGSHNRILQVDLDSGKQDVMRLENNYWLKFIGGSTLAARLVADTDGPTADPLSPANPLLVMTGPMVGTNFPGSSRFVMCARSPLTGIWGESASGGFFGAQLKKAGFDGVVLRGKCDRPSYLAVEKGRAEIVDAGDLWGLDTYECIDRLKQHHADKQQRLRVLAIGPAGERMVRFAAVANDKAHYLGRTGMGAVMGSKNLKAVVVPGNQKIPVAREDAYRAIRQAALADIRDSMICASFHDLGTAAAMDMGMLTGDVPIKNWSLGEGYEMAAAIGGPAIHENMLQGRTACYACPIGCKPVVQVVDAKYPVSKGPGPEYETCAGFGTMIMNDNLAAIAYLNELCNRLGLDTITCGATVAFIMDCYENGLMTRADLDGLDMRWGNIDAVIELVKKIGLRDGIGDTAALGSRAMADHVKGNAADYSVAVKGLELPMHDPRAFHGLGLAYMSSSRGACHLQHTVQAVEQGMVAWPEIGLKEDYPATESSGKAKMVSICENIGQLANAACVCHFVFWAMGLDNFLGGFNAVTGYDFSMADCLAAGERAWVLKRALNNIMGVTAEDDRLPKKILTALADGAAAGSVPDEKLMRREYYQIRGLDEKGVPTPQLLQKTGLGFLQKRLSSV